MPQIAGVVALFSLTAFTFAASHPNWDALRKQIKATLHVPEPLPDVDSRSYGAFTPAPGVRADRVSYSTDYDLRIPAIVYHPAGATISLHPAIVIVNGDFGDKSSWYAYWAGIVYARAGAVVLTYDLLANTSVIANGGPARDSTTRSSSPKNKWRHDSRA